MDPGSAAHHAARHSASKTRVNALMALRSIRGTYPLVLAPTTNTRSRLAARCARVADESFAQENRGRGECRVPVAPAVPCALVLVERTRVTTSTPESPGIPARNGFTAYVALSPVTGLFCHRHQRISGLSAPGRADLPSARLDASVGASGPHDFAVRSNISRPHAL